MQLLPSAFVQPLVNSASRMFLEPVPSSSVPPAWPGHDQLSPGQWELPPGPWELPPRLPASPLTPLNPPSAREKQQASDKL